MKAVKMSFNSSNKVPRASFETQESKLVFYDDDRSDDNYQRMDKDTRPATDVSFSQKKFYGVHKQRCSEIKKHD